MIPACGHTGTLSPLPFLDHVEAGPIDEHSDPNNRAAPPIIQFIDSRIDQTRRESFTPSSLELLLLFFMVVTAFIMVIVGGLLSAMSECSRSLGVSNQVRHELFSEIVA
jgi:hypothetical protein